MARTKKPTASLDMTVKADNAISDGEGGYLKKGAKFAPADDEARASLKAKGLAE